MEHVAKIGSNGKVIQVLTLNNSDMWNSDGVEDEAVGQQYLETHNNWPAQMWLHKWYLRKKVCFASDRDLEMFSDLEIFSGTMSPVNFL